MEEKPKSVTMNGLTIGAVTAIVMIVYSLIMYIFNLHLNQTLGIIAFVFLLAGIIWGTIQFRNQCLNGFISYGKAFSAGFMVALFASLFMAVYMFVFYQFIAPDAVNDLMDMSRQRMVDSNPNLSDDDIDKAMEFTSFLMKPWTLAIAGLIQMLIVSAILSLITSIFLKKEDKTLTSAM
jgi:hypothetical protein